MQNVLMIEQLIKYIGFSRSSWGYSRCMLAVSSIHCDIESFPGTIVKFRTCMCLQAACELSHKLFRHMRKS